MPWRPTAIGRLPTHDLLLNFPGRPERDQEVGGFSEQQAETQARAQAEILDRLDRQITTKSEVAEHEDNLRREIREAELRLEAKLAETNARIAAAKAELTRWVVGAGVLQTTLIIGVQLKVGKLI